MGPREAEGRLNEMLAAAGFSFEAPDPKLGWNVFKRFCAVAVHDVEDGVLWQIGCYDFTGEMRCHLDFVRQFSFDEDGEYDHMEQLHLEFTSQPTAVLRSLERNAWAFDHASLDAFFVAVESLPEFRTALDHTEWLVNVRQEQV